MEANESSCQLDAERMVILKPCMEIHGKECASSDEWPWNCLSRQLVVFSCGAIARRGHPVAHQHDPRELALCEEISLAAANVVKNLPVGMGSESIDHFRPFFIAANVGDAVPAAIDEPLIRNKFGGTIYPAAPIWVEPLEERGEWWSQVRADCQIDETLPDEDVPWRHQAELDLQHGRDCYQRWQEMIQWFHAQPHLHGLSFVMIGEDPLGGENGGCVFPRLPLGITAAGSVVGLFAHVVHT